MGNDSLYLRGGRGHLRVQLEDAEELLANIVRLERVEESSALAGRDMDSDPSPGALPRADMLRAVGASLWLSSLAEKTATKRCMK